MHIRPELAALRSNDAPQRLAQRELTRILDDWHRTGPGAAVETEIADFHGGKDLDDLPLLGALFDPRSDRTESFLDTLLAPLLRKISDAPLGQSPLRCSTSEVSNAIMIARCANTALVLHYTSGIGLAAQPEVDTASFIPAETWERVLAGAGEAVQVCLSGAGPDRADLQWNPVSLQVGDVRHRDGREEALVLRSVPNSLVQLRLQRRIDNLLPVRQYRLADGALVHQAAGTPRDSRLELTATPLGRMKRRDAAPMLAAMAEEQGADGLRWQVLRECLGLDTAIGFRALSTIADRADDPLQAPAAALRGTLIGMYPELKELAPCPA